MPGFAPMKQNAFYVSLFLFILQIPLLGCGDFSGKSEYQKFKDGQQTFAQSIKSAGGSAELKEFSMFGFTATGWKIDLSRGKVTGKLIDQLIVASRGAPVLDLNLSGTEFSDEQLGKLDAAGVLAKTVNLDLSKTKVSDAGLDKVNAIVALTYLNLEGTQATKAGAERLGKRKIANPSTPLILKKQPELKI